MQKDCCKTCKHYFQHYILDHRGITRVYCGHCTFGRVKTKRPDANACENYFRADSDVSAFVSKEYLRKELLRYVLSLDLLPEIRNMDGQSEKAGNNQKIVP